MALTRKAKKSLRREMPDFGVGWPGQPFRRAVYSHSADPRREDFETKLALNNYLNKTYIIHATS